MYWSKFTIHRMSYDTISGIPIHISRLCRQSNYVFFFPTIHSPKGKSTSSIHILITFLFCHLRTFFMISSHFKELFLNSLMFQILNFHWLNDFFFRFWVNEERIDFIMMCVFWVCVGTSGTWFLSEGMIWHT